MITCLLLPGMDGTGKLFDRFRPHLPPQWRVTIVAYPAQEVSSFDRLVEHVEAEIPPTGAWLIVAESFSGPIALRLASRDPPRLVAVVLVATFLSSPVRGGLRWLLGAAAGALAALPFPSRIVDRLLVGGDGELGLEVRRAVESLAPAVVASRVRMLLRTDALTDLAACSVPLLVIGGHDDRLLGRRAMAEFEAHRPDAEHRTIRAPHLVLQAEPRASAEAIREFVERVHPQR